MDKYIKVKKIGEGSFGRAILVKSKENGEHFVVKEIGISKMKPKEKSEARKEVTVLSKMRHPNIVQYTESFEENGHLYIVMEYCEGGDLYELINKQKGVPFSEQQVLNWFVQLCLALKHVHDRKILHRDIKTSNIFLSKSGIIKLGDFGIARVLNNTMELAKTCIGTPYYLSPEICENKPYNNKSDVWALGCVVYETLTLKHAFEAGNMKNLVLKIIRGSYPPVPSRYSYDLRILVSQLFRRNPRERPSINSILRMPFLSQLTEQFLTPEQHEEEFSHTVLHKGRPPRPSSAKPSQGGKYGAAGKRAQNLEVRGGAIGRNRRGHQIASVYGSSVAAKKPKSAASRAAKPDDYLERRRLQLLEQEKRRKEAIAEEKKKRLEDLQKRQRERALRMKQDQLKRARDEARAFNLKRSVELNVKNVGESLDNAKNQKVSNAPEDRPISAAKERGDYEKYHQYLDKFEKGDKLGAAQFAAPGLDRVKKAWDDRQKGQEAVLAAQINKMAAEQAAGRAQVVSEFLQRKREAHINKQNYMRAKENKVGVAAALQPYSAPSAKDVEERKYLAKLHQIRQQNYHERKALHQKQQAPYKVEIPASDDLEDNEAARKMKVLALQQQAVDRAKFLQENKEMRREKLDARQEMKLHEAKARARGIIPPNERPVNYNPKPIGITQALGAVGVSVQTPGDKSVEEAQQVLSPSRADPHLRKKILKRVNQRFSVDFEDDEKSDSTEVEKKVEESPTKKETSRQVPEKSNEEPRKESAWKARKNDDFISQISDLPLQNTTSLFEVTNVPVPSQPSVPKRVWQNPGDTFVRQLNLITLEQPTMTTPVEAKIDEESTAGKQPEKSTKVDKKTPSKTEEPASEEKKSPDRSATPIDSKTIVLRKSPVQDSVATPSAKKEAEKILAPNFKPMKPSGTYVIKSLDLDQRLDDVNNEKSSAKNDETPPKLPPRDDIDVSKARISNRVKDAKINLGNPAKPTDNSDEIEEVELENESKTQNKLEKLQTAWTETSESEDAKSKPSLLPKPNLLPKPPISPKSPSTSSDAKSISPSPKKSSPEASKSVSASDDNSTCESPLFVKVNRIRPENVSTTPNPQTEKLEEAKSPEDRLSKTLYSTASDQMLMKLTLGHFDSPNPKLLRTCSLPDLNAKSEESGVKDEDVEDESSMMTMNDTNFDDDENPNLSDDEDLDDLRANLQSVLMNSSKPESETPSFTDHLSAVLNGASDSSSSEDEDRHLHEEWQSDSESSSEDDVSDTESVFSRLEHNREELERELGLEKFLQAYRYVQATHEDEDEGVMECQSRVRAVLGNKHDVLYPKILQLVMADGVYCEDNT